MSELIKIGSTGVRVNQTNLNVTGHNIANVDTDGYSRQDALQVTNSALSRHYGYAGQGANTDTIRRISNEFLTTQLRNDTSLAKEREMLLQYSKQLDRLLADPDASPGNALNEFFAAMQALADDPNNNTLRNQVLAQSDSLAQRFNLMDERFTDMQESINIQIESSVGEINRLASGIADLNRAILEAESRHGQPANDLKDKREEHLRQLSEYIDVDVTQSNDGRLTVSLGKGFPLVVGDKSYALESDNISSDARKLGVFLTNKENEQIDVTGFVRGGDLGGLLRYRNEVMSPAQNDLGRLALTIGETFNAQHKLGIDLNNELGGNFFKDANTQTLMAGRSTSYLTNDSTSNIRFDVEITDTSALTNKDYVLKAEAGNQFSMYDTDGNRVQFNRNGTLVNTVSLADLGNAAVTVQVDGFRLSESALSGGGTGAGTGTVAQGDRFLIQPAKYAGGDFARDIASPDEIAVALPVRFEASLSNTGSGELRGLEVSATYAGATGSTTSPNSAVTITAPSTGYAFVDTQDNQLKIFQGVAGSETVQTLSSGLDIVFNATPAVGQLTYQVRSPSGDVLHEGTYTQGIEQDMLPASWGIQFRIGGNPDLNDRYELSFNTDGTGDNGNALQLTALQGEPTLEGDMSYQDAYSHTVTRIASQTAEAEITAQSGASILEQTRNLRDGVSGVNLDEEAANLVRFQQAYNASSQIISTAKQLFDTLLQAVR